MRVVCLMVVLGVSLPVMAQEEAEPAWAGTWSLGAEHVAFRALPHEVVYQKTLLLPKSEEGAPQCERHTRFDGSFEADEGELRLSWSKAEHITTCDDGTLEREPLTDQALVDADPFHGKALRWEIASGKGEERLELFLSGEKTAFRILQRSSRSFDIFTPGHAPPMEYMRRTPYYEEVPEILNEPPLELELQQQQQQGP